MAHSPSAYIPIDRYLALAQGEALPTHTRGAALLADISGFTPLTEALAQELGPKRGAEELTKQLNRIYGALIREVNQHRGSLISFSGDAITCWFEGDDGLRATACALALQQAMLPLGVVKTPSGAAIALAIKVAVASGPARRFQLGDPSIQYIDTLAGATLDRLAATEHLARKDEVVVSPEVIHNTGEAILVRDWVTAPDSDEQGAVVITLLSPVALAPWPELTLSLNAEAVRPWLLPDIADDIWAGEEAFLAELRPAALLFARFGGIDYDTDPEAHAKLDAYVRWAQQVVTRHAGVVLQLTIGDKGAYFYCAFGAPVAHDDDPARAVAAALELRRHPPELEFLSPAQLGLSWGRIWAGPYGGPTRRTYGVLGDEVNLAARLMSLAAPGQIIISQRLAQEVQHRYRLQSLGEVAVKGKQAPITIAEVQDHQLTRRSAGHAEPLIGRQQELEQIAAALRLAQTGQGQIFRVVGSAGVGKSRLCATVLEQARALNLQVVSGVCQSTTERTAYAPWRQVFEALFDFAAETSPGQDNATVHAQHIRAVENFIAQTNPQWGLRLPLLGDLLSLPIPDNATTAAFEPRLRQSALLDLAVEMMLSWAEQQPLLILLDDAHWMDEASQSLTLALGRALAHAPILLLLVHRPPLTLTDILPALAELPYHQGLTLDELTPEGVAELTTHKLGGPANTLTLSLIMAETQGNPFFVEELIDSLRESDHLRHHADGRWMLSDELFAALQKSNSLARSEAGHWQLAPHVSLSAVDLGLPDSIQGVVLSRIDRLPQPHKLTLKVASVIGRSFAFDLLSHAHPSRPDEPTLTEHAASLEAREFTRLETPPHQTYSFKHTVTRDVTYETLLFDQRRQLHRAVGAALEELSPEAVSQLAHHTFTGEDWERALRYEMAAGQQAQRLFVNHEGVEHFRKALVCAGHLPPEQTAAPRQQIHVSLGELLTTTGQYDPALEHLQQALALAADMNDPDAQAKACYRIAYGYELQSEYALALEWIQKGLQLLEGRETVFSAELLALAGLIYNRQGKYDLALERCEHSIRVATEFNEASILGRAYNARAQISYSQGNTTNAIEYYQRAAALYEQTQNIQGQAMSFNGIGTTYQEMGRWPEASPYLRRAREVFTQTGDELHRLFADNNLGEIARQQGRLSEALASYQSALNSLEKLGGSKYVIGVIHMNLGATYVRQKEIEAARQHLRLSLRLFEQVQARDFLAELHTYLAEAALVAREIAEANAQGQLALALARELGMRGEEGKCLRVLGEIANAEGNRALAKQRFQDSLAILEEAKQEYHIARSQLSLAQTLHTLGENQRSRELLNQCLSVFERLDAILDLQIARELQSHLSARPPVETAS